MAAPVKVRSSVGFRSTQIFAIDQSTGLPAATSVSPYDGVLVVGSNTMNITFPEARQIEHVGDDFVMLLDILPPNTAATGEMIFSSTNDILDEVLTANKSYVVGESNQILIATDNQGYEPQVCALTFREAAANDPTSPTLGQRLWDYRIFPRSYFIPREGSYDANPELHAYTFRPQFCTQFPWGIAFSKATHNAKRAQWVRGVSKGRPHLVAWKQTGVGAVFLFNTDFPCANTTGATFWTNGVLETSPTVTTTQVTLTTPPASNAIVVGLYEF